MFRKLVSNLPFSPALIHDVGFYARRLKKEEATRRLSLLFIVLALAMQSLAVFSPPESANASSEQDIIRGGVTSLEDLLTRYDRNDDDLRDILGSVGITRAEIVAMQPGSIGGASDTYVLTRYGQLSSQNDEASLSYQRSVGGIDVRYFSPLAKMSSSSSFSGWIGQSASIGWFGIMRASGNLATHGLPASVSPTSTLSVATKSLEAANLTQASDNAANTVAKPLDKIAYTLKATNTTSATVTESFSVRLADALQYSSLIDAGGASLESATSRLSWPTVQLKPGESQERTFVVQLLSQLPATPSGLSDPTSYDCKMTLTFGDSLNTPVNCPPIKAAETLIGQLPATGVAANIAFAAIIISIIGFFFLRTRQLKKEIRIIRHDLNTGIMN